MDGAVYYDCQKGKHPPFLITPFTPCFLSFTFSFYPLFHFALVCALFPSPLGNRAFPIFRPLRRGATILSQHIQNLFTLYLPREGILNMSAGEAANLLLNSLPIFLFLFYPPFSNLCSESAERRRSVSPNGRRRFANVLPEAYSFRREGLCRHFVLRPNRAAF